MTGPSTESAGAEGTVDLTNCDREPIHIPGSIQPHGTLVAVDPADGTILQAAANAAAILGRPAEALLGRPLADLLGDDLAARLRATDLTPGHPQPAQPVPVALTGTDGVPRLLDCAAHLHRGRMIVEIEPRAALPEADEAAIATVCMRAMAAMAAARTLTEAAGLAIGAIAAVTGFDRVMAYRFHEDWHGEIIAERHAGLSESYLGLHYPATDIPVQARRLYAENLIRVIPDAGYRAVPLLPQDDPRTGMPLDMTHVGLRSVSPIHLEYLANMGVRATVTVSVPVERRLWGMLACHHSGPKRVPAAVRAAVQQLGIVFAAQVARLADRRRLAEAAARRTVAGRLVAAFEASGSVAGAVAAGADGLAALFGAEGLLWRIDGSLAVSGAASGPPATDAPADGGPDGLPIEALRRAAGGGALLTDALPALAGGPQGRWAGAVFLPLAGEDFLLALRPEYARTVRWAGDPAKPVRPAEDGSMRLHPRRSFAAWAEEVRGRSRPFTAADRDAAAALRRTLLGLQSRAAEQRGRARLAAVRAALPDLLFHIDAAGTLLDVHAPDPRVLALPPQACPGRGVGEVLPAEAVGPTLQAVRRAIETGAVQAVEYALPGGPDGAAYVDGRAAPVGDGTVLLVLRDITARRRQENEQRALKERYEGLLAANPAVVYAARPDGDYRPTFVSDKLREILGYEPEAFLADPGLFLRSIHPDDAARVLGALGGSAPDGHQVHEYRVRHRDGSWRWVQDEIRVLSDAGGRPVKLIGSLTDITDRRRTEEDLAASRELFALAVEATRDGIWDWDLRTGEIWFSPRWKEQLGYRDDELPDTLEMWAGLIFPEDRAAALRLAEDYTSGRVPAFEAVQRFRHKAGHTVYIHSRAIHVKDETGRAVRMVGAHTDITEQKRAEQALRESEERFRDYAGSASDWFWEMGPDLRFSYFSERLLEVAGIDPAEAIGLTRPELSGMLRPGDAWAAHLDDLENRRPFRDFEYPVLRRRDGATRHIRTSGTPVFAADGRFLGYRGAASDITAAVEAERLLQDSEARFRDMALNVPGVIFQWYERRDGSHGYYYVSPRVEDIYGVRPEELLADWRRLPIHPDDMARWTESIARVLTEGTDWSFEGRFVTPSGAVRWWRGISRPVSSGPEEMVFNGIVIDIQEQKEAEERLAASERRFRELIEEAMQGIVIHRAGRPLFANAAFAAILGYGSIGEVLALPSLQILLPEDDRAETMAVWTEAGGGGDPQVMRKVRLIRKDGEAVWVDAMARRVVWMGEPAVQSTIVDVSDVKLRELELEESRRRLERQAVQLAQLAEDYRREKIRAEEASRAKSEMLANMSHELRTPLNAVIGFSEIMLNGYFGPVGSARYQEYIADIHTSAMHLLDLINDILDLTKIESGKHRLEESTIALADLIESAILLVRERAADKRIALSRVVAAMPPVLADGRALKQVLVNLLTNAVKFTPAGGRVEVAAGLDGDGRVAITIADSGIGIPHEDIPKVLEAFGQAGNSRATGESGTGLGLAIVRSLVRMHGGDLGIESELGRGTRITVRLPAERVRPGSAASPAAPTSPPCSPRSR